MIWGFMPMRVTNHSCSLGRLLTLDQQIEHHLGASEKCRALAHAQRFQGGICAPLEVGEALS